MFEQKTSDIDLKWRKSLTQGPRCYVMFVLLLLSQTKKRKTTKMRVFNVQAPTGFQPQSLGRSSRDWFETHGPHPKFV